MAQLGRRVFFDSTLSSSGALSCASCHSPQRAYGPPGNLPVMQGGRTLARQGVRAVPSLMYLERQPNFSIGPDDAENEAPPAPLPPNAPAIAVKSAQNTVQSAQNLVPQGGLFWDGRANTLQSQALEPLLDPLEMDGGTLGRVAQQLHRAPYAARFVQLFGPQIFDRASTVVGEALFAVARYQIEDRSFHPYSSKYDAWLEGKGAPFTGGSARLRAFSRSQRCELCRVSSRASGREPFATALHRSSVRSAGRAAQHDASCESRFSLFDLGICGPVRSDMKRAAPYCGMFLTPTLRNVATRHAFFHNGVYHTLQQVLDFYNFRSTRPQRVYRHGVPDDLPPSSRANLDTVDAPFDRKRGDTPPALTAPQERDIIAFLQTLTDGYRPAR